MKQRTIRLFLILATVSIIGITATQLFWVKKAFDLKETQFNHNVNLALRNVAQAILTFNNHKIPAANTVKQLSSDYFVVMVNDVIDANLLETLLRREFGKRNLTTDFEYGIYDCQTETMVYGNYVSLNPKQADLQKPSSLPVWNKDLYYFGVYFPDKDSNLLSQLGIWVYSTIMLLVVIVFFAYTMFVILKQRRLSEIQRDFINNMTHEFKTPIATIAISAETLRNPNMVQHPARLLNYATIIQDEATRLKNQVERVLQMATADREKLKLNKEPVNIHDLVHQVTANMQLALQEKNGRISYFLEALQPVITADKLHLTNIIYNLLDNAIKYCKTEPDISISTCNTSGGITISIKDNGIGINAENSKKVFDKFYRVPTGDVHDVKGFGLGLNYVQLLVKAHHGRITLESDGTSGSTFHVYLPFG
jgi:two-component system, OmpR family, phosphate regulon sensor histidine kinase PhoR